MLEHRRALVAARTLGLHHVADQISKLAPRSATSSTAAERSKPGCAASNTSTPPAPTLPPADIGSNGSKRSSNRTAKRAARSAVSNGASTSCSTATAPPGATSPASAPSPLRCCCARSATLPGSTARPEFARWCGTGAVALSSGDRNDRPVKHRLDIGGNRRINSVLHIASVTRARPQPDAAALSRPQNW